MCKQNLWHGVVMACLLSGCASFGTPNLADVLDDQQQCSESWACRALIEDRPLPLVLAVREDPEATRCVLAGMDITSTVYGRFAIAQWDGREYALGYSWACRGVCSVREAQRE